MAVVEISQDLDRILALPRRLPVVCAKDESLKRYPPSTEALVSVMTARYSRGPRISCACRPRVIARGEGDLLMIGRVLPSMEAPEPPLMTSFEGFVRDNQRSVEELKLVDAVRALSPGQSLRVPAFGGEMGPEDPGHPCILGLNAIQAWVLKEAPKVGGVVGFLGVGSGKSICGVLAPLAFSDCKQAMILAEPGQRKHYKSQYLRLREHFRVPSIVFDDEPGYTVVGTPPLHFLPYSKLSHASASDLLEKRAPDVLICDEAHRIAGISARTRRVLRFLTAQIRAREAALAEGKPVRSRATRFLVWSGTLEPRSIKDTQHLMTHALGDGSPAPLDPNEAEAWSAVIDPVKQPDRTSSCARRLQHAFGGGVVEHSVSDLFIGGPEEEIRKNYARRRIETLGVVSTTVASIGASIYFRERSTPKMPAAIKQALAMVRQGERPDGDELVDQSEIVRCVRDVASGYYYRWVFRREDPDHLIDEWFQKRKLWLKELRAKLLVGEVHLDSPLLCQNAAIRFWQESKYEGDLPVWASEHWPAWAEIKDRVPHTPGVVWVDEYLAQDAAEWARQNKGIVWYLGDPFGKKVADLAGLPCHGGGPDAEKNIMAERGDRSIIASVAAHGQGRDGLQYLFDIQLVSQMPSSNTRVEQLLGRLHRVGQPSDAITTEAYLPVHESREALRKVIAQAEFSYQMTGNQQKILTCDMEIDL